MVDSEHKLLLVKDLGLLMDPTGDNKLSLPELGVTVELLENETLPICPLLLVALVLEFPPLFHSGHSGYCWEPSWDWELDWIAVSSELMVSSVEGILSTCAKAQNGPLGQYPVCRISLHLVDL